jgi:Abnormal spindle-like microcephaly-assoc'd, ASPM-SPD-2-Hydin
MKLAIHIKSLRKWGPGGFFALDVIYVAVLAVLLIARQADWLWIDRIHNPIGGIVPLGVPWFGALGAVTISIYGIVDHNDHWQTKWGLWHAIRPVVGAILGTVAYLIFVGLIQATGTTPTSVKASSSPNVNTIIYLVIAFVVGFREETFRSLIKRVVDLILSPGDTSTSPTVSITPTPVEFGVVAIGQNGDAVVTISNTGNGPLVLNGDSAEPPGVDLHGDAAFTIADGALAGATINPSASATLKLRFAPGAPGEASSTLTIASNAGKFPVPMTGTGQ